MPVSFALLVRRPKSGDLHSCARHCQVRRSFWRRVASTSWCRLCGRLLLSSPPVVVPPTLRTLTNMSAVFVGALYHVTAASMVDVLVRRVVVSVGAKQLGGVTPGGYTAEVACLHVVWGVPAAWATCPPLESMAVVDVWSRMGWCSSTNSAHRVAGVGCWGATRTLPWVGRLLHILSGAKASLRFSLFTVAMALVW